MGAAAQLMADMHILPKTEQLVRSKNHAPYAANRMRRTLFGDPVKATIDKMIVFPHARDVQEDGCVTLCRLAAGEYFNGLVGLYGGVQLVMGLIERDTTDSLMLYACVRALIQFAENGPNAEIMRSLGCEARLVRLAEDFKEDAFLKKDCEAFCERIQLTGLKLAREFVENSVIEEDVSSLMKYLDRYYNLADIVNFGVTAIEEFLEADETNVVKFVDDGDLTTFLKIIAFHKASPHTMYHVFSILYILAKNVGLSTELGKAGLIKVTIEQIREKKAGVHGELLQMLLFTLNRLCIVDANCILFHKLMGDIIISEIEESISEDVYEYPVAMPYRLKKLMQRKEEYLALNELGVKAVHPARDDMLAERKLYEDESLVKAIILKRPAAVIAYKKAQEAWAHEGTVFDPLSGDTAYYAGKPHEVKLTKLGFEEEYDPRGKTIEIEQEGWDPSDPVGPQKGGVAW